MARPLFVRCPLPHHPGKRIGKMLIKITGLLQMPVMIGAGKKLKHLDADRIHSGFFPGLISRSSEAFSNCPANIYPEKFPGRDS